MSRILSIALCYIAAAQDPVFEDAIPRDLPLRQLRGEMKPASASEESPAKQPQETNVVSEGEADDEAKDETDDGNDYENDDGNDDENDDGNDEGDFHDATDLDAEAVENACVDQPGWDTDFSHRMYKCALKNLGNAKKGGKCMAEKQGVSRDCGGCMGKLMKCSKPCARKCCSGKCMEKSRCKKCVRSRCASSFKKCAGVDAP